MTRTSERRKNLLRTVLPVVAMLWASADVSAQNVPPLRIPVVPAPNNRGSAAQAEDLTENVFLPPDRHTLQKLSDSRKLLEERRFGEAVRCLDAILEEPEDFFFQPDRRSPIHRSLKTEAQRLIGQMPAEGRELYELQYGARARRMLEESLESGDMAALAEVSRRFFHTQSGYQATFLLGLDHFDHGRPLAGALTLQRLREAGGRVEELEPGLSLTLAACWLQSGMMSKAQETLVALRRQHPDLRVSVENREVPIFTDDARALDWFMDLLGPRSAINTGEAALAQNARQWLMFRGNAARSAEAHGGMPLLNPRWRVSNTTNPTIEGALNQLERQIRQEGMPLLPALHPLAVDDVLLMRTARNLLAVNLRTGKRLWETSAEDEEEMLTGADAAERGMQRSMIVMGLGQRLWNDLTYGALSSDGARVFAIEDLDFSYGPAGNILFQLGRKGRNPRIVMNAEGQEVILTNRLAAFDVATGQTTWSIGGPEGKDASPLAGTFFLGPPLPLLEQLYVMGECQGEIRLMALEPATGKLLWSQQLSMIEQSVTQDPQRRVAGLSPSYADGILLCPTSTGAIVAVDLSTRSLLWGYRYEQSKNRRNQNNIMLSSLAGGEPPQTRWLDGEVAIVDDHVLFTPIESDTLYCLGLLDGKEVWRCPRGKGLYVACADREQVVLVGLDGVRALRTADGKPAWNGRIVALGKESVPSGRGFRTGDRYYLPLSTAEVAVVDLDAGKIGERVKTRKGDVLGNLICHQNKLISQGFGGVEAFYLLDDVRNDVQRRLKTNSDDAEALTLQGETLLESNQRREAVESFRRAYALEADPHTRELLRDALIDGLRRDFATYREFGPELERLLREPAEKSVYLRLMAEGLRRAGQWGPAWEYFAKIADLPVEPMPLESIDEDHAVRRDRWFQSQVALLREESRGDPSVRTIDAAITSRLNRAMADTSIEPLRQFVDFFGNHPSAEAGREELVRRLRAGKRLLEAELTSPRSVAVEKASREKPSRWPEGIVESKIVPTKNLQENGYGRFVLEMRGDPGPFFAETALHFDDGRRMLLGDDAWGRRQWQISLAAEGQRQNFAFNRAWASAQAQNHLLVVTLGWRILAVDTARSGNNATPRLLWTRDLASSNFESMETGTASWPAPNLPWQWQQRIGRVSGQSSLTSVVTSRYVCFQQLHDLVAVDPLRGEMLWTRGDVPSGSELFGDDDFVFVLPPEQADAILFRASDGELLGTRSVPRLSGRGRPSPDGQQHTYARLDDYCLAMLGRRMLLWWPDDNQRVLTLVDPYEGRDLWPGYSFSGNAQCSVFGDKAVGVADPATGRFMLIGLRDGKVLIDHKLEIEPPLVDITLLADEERYYLLTRGAPGHDNAQINIQPISGSDPKPIYQGRLYAFGKDGKPQWPQPAPIDRQFLLLDQPARLPILSFACQAFEQQENGGGRQMLSIMTIDKRNGRVAYKGAFANSMALLDLFGDEEKKTVDLVLQRNTVRLSFSDKPLPPMTPEEYQPALLSPESNKLQGLWKSVEKAIDRALDEWGKKK